MQGLKINGFELKRLLGKGGMAEVWYAENRIGKNAAVKILMPKYCKDEIVIARFQKEAKIMVGLNHLSIRQVYSDGEIEGRPCIIMEYLEGKDLKSRLKDDEKFDDCDLIKWWNQLADALNYTHKKGIIHRDIKPSNIFIDDKGNAKLIDFGIAKEEGGKDLTQTGALLGTILYMSPEQVRGTKKIDYRTDLYSLAVTFVHLITGKTPYDVTTSDDLAIRNSIAGKKLNLSSLPKEWRRFLAPYLEKEPDKRPTLTLFKQESKEKEERKGEKKKDYVDDDTLLDGHNSRKPDDIEEKENDSGKVKDRIRIRKYVKVGLGVVVVALLIFTICFLKWPKKDEDTQQFLACNVVDDYRQYLKIFPNGKHYEEAAQIIDSFIADSINRVYNACVTLVDFRTLSNRDTTDLHYSEAKAFVERYVADSIEEVNQTRQQSIKEEDAAYKNCTTLDACNKYLKTYPKGRYLEEVRSKIIELEKTKDKNERESEMTIYKPETEEILTPLPETYKNEPIVIYYFSKDAIMSKAITNINDDELRKVINTYSIKGFKTKIWCSPDETQIQTISNNRARKIEKHIKGIIEKAGKSVNKYSFFTYDYGSDWDRFIDMVQNSDIEDKDEIVNSIRNASNRVEMINSLISAYPMLKEYMPILRRAEVIVY